MPPPELIQSFCSLTLYHDTKIAKISSDMAKLTRISTRDENEMRCGTIPDPIAQYSEGDLVYSSRPSVCVCVFVCLCMSHRERERESIT